MNAFIRLFSSLFSAPNPQSQDEAYLAESVDIYDLERRMRQLDQRRIDGPRQGSIHSLTMR